MIRIIGIALVINVICGTIAVAATCLSSAADVRKQQPKAWPKWTYGSQGERCWYAGRKPIIARAPMRQAKTPQPNAMSSAEPSTSPPRPGSVQSEGSVPQSRPAAGTTIFPSPGTWSTAGRNRLRILQEPRPTRRACIRKGPGTHTGPFRRHTRYDISRSYERDGLSSFHSGGFS
jgi:hypothetical protein